MTGWRGRIERRVWGIRGVALNAYSAAALDQYLHFMLLTVMVFTI